MSDREAFEKWAADKCHLDSFEINGEKQYAALTANIMWEAWQAAQAQAVNQQLLDDIVNLLVAARGAIKLGLDVNATNYISAAIAAAQENNK